MKELEIIAIKVLIEFYTLYTQGANQNYLKKRAKELYDSTPAMTLVHDCISNAFGALFPIAYPNVGSGLKPPTKEEAKKIIKALEKRKKELEK